MLRRHSLLIQNLMVYFDSGLVLLTYTFGIELRWLVQSIMGVPNADFKPGEFLNFGMLGTSIAIVLIGNKALGLYQSHRVRSLVGEIGRIFAVNLVLFTLLLSVATLLSLPNGNLSHILAFLILNVAGAAGARCVVRLVARQARSKGYNFRNLLVIGTGRGDMKALLEKVNNHPTWGFKVLAVLAPEGDGMPSWAFESLAGNPSVLGFEKAAEVLEKEPVDEIWFNGFPSESQQYDVVAQQAADQGVLLRYILPREHFPGMHWNFESFDNVTTLAASHSPMDDLARITKRAIDVGFSATVLAISIPLIMLPVSIVLWFQKGGKRQVLFRQLRVGLNGRVFPCYKFRSMIPDAESKLAELQKHNEMEGPVFKMKRDPRITPFGAFIRKFSIDEFPQFFNVLKGDMSLVGPRPPIPKEVDMYERTQRRRLSVKPGITGLWQVEGRNEIVSFEEWVRLDLEYIDRWSLWLDFKILLKTVFVVFKGR